MPVQQAGSVLGLRLAMAPEEEGPALRGRQLLRTQNGPLALPPFILIFLLILICLAKLESGNSARKRSSLVRLYVALARTYPAAPAPITVGMP